MHLRFVIICGLFCVLFQLHGQDTARRVQVYDRTIHITSEMRQVKNDSGWCGGGYITDGTDTLFYSRCTVLELMYVEMIYMACDPFDQKRCDSINAEVKQYNDSLRKEDSRLGHYHDTSMTINQCWYYWISPNRGEPGYLGLEIHPQDQGISFAISTTILDADKQGKWKSVIESLK